MEEVEISIKDLCYRILRGWRSILVCILVFALLLYAVTALKNKNSNISESEKKEQAEKLRKELEEEDILIADGAIVLYQTYKQYCEYVRDYPIMSMDASNVPTLNMSYSIDTHYMAEYPVIQYKDQSGAILETYVSELVSQETYEQLAETFVSKIDVKYIPKLFMVWSTGNMLRIQLMAPTLEDCEKQAALIDEIIKEKTAKIKDLYGDFDITQIKLVCAEEFQNYVQDEKRNAVASMEAYRNSYENMEKTLTAKQKAYYDACVRTMGYDDEKIKNISYTKRIIIGALLGAILACGIIFASYIMSSTLRNKDDIESGFHLAIIGAISAEAASKKWFRGIDKLIYKLFYGRGPKFTEEERINMICAGIRISTQKENYQKIYLTGTGNDDETLRIQSLISEQLKKEKIDVGTGISVVYDPESLERMSASDAVVFVERVGESLYKDIDKQKKLAERYKIPVLGAVVIE